jgi:hypothetical protein
LERLTEGSGQHHAPDLFKLLSGFVAYLLKSFPCSTRSVRRRHVASSLSRAAQRRNSAASRPFPAILAFMLGPTPSSNAYTARELEEMMGHAVGCTCASFRPLPPTPHTFVTYDRS